MAARKLRAAPEPTPEPTRAKRSTGRPKSLSTLAAAGDELAVAMRLRDMLAAQLEAKPPAAAFAALSKQFRDVTAEIRALKDKGREDDSDADDDPDDDWDPDSI